jgi:chromosome segregation ATPase
VKVTAKKGTNGGTSTVTALSSSEEKACANRQTEIMASIDELARSVGLMLQRHEQLSFQLVEVMGHLAQVAERQTVTDQRVERLHSDITSLTSEVARAAMAAMREHLGAVVQYEVDQRLRAAGGR